jgi:hypothetical protein
MLSVFDQDLTVGLRSLFGCLKRLFLAVSSGHTARQRLNPGVPAAVVFLFTLDLEKVGFHGAPFETNGVIVFHALRIGRF